MQSMRQNALKTGGWTHPAWLGFNETYEIAEDKDGSPPEAAAVLRAAATTAGW